VDTLEREEPALDGDARGAVAADAGGAHDAVAWEEEQEPVPGAERPDGSWRAWMTCQRCELPVADDLAPRDGAEASGDSVLKRRGPAQIERDVAEVLVLACEERGEALDEHTGVDVALPDGHMF